MSETVGKPRIEAARIVVIMPNWLGDGVMATPFLRALRGIHAGAHIAAVARPLVMPVLAGLPFVNEGFAAEKGDEANLVRWLKKNRFDLGILLPNSLRSAWVLWRGGVKRRLGYARGGRGALLTDRLKPVKRSVEQQVRDEGKAAAIREFGGPSLRIGSAFEPVPAIDYYLRLAEYLGATELSRQMELGVTGEEAAEVEGVLAQVPLNAAVGPHGYVVLVPGANFGASKCWLPERFAQLALSLANDAWVLIAGSPAEAPLIRAICKGASDASGMLHNHIVPLSELNGGRGISLGALKEIVRRSRLMICNDTGPRHFAAAFGVPVVTLFGPTDPVWAETYFEKERKVRVEVPCGPCQFKKCPIDHRCMRQISVEMVMEAVGALWNAR